MRKIELLVPASSLEVLKIAVVFGADAVYIGGEAFGLRAKAKNFSKEDMAEGIAFAHEHGVKVYVTVNILAHNDDLPGVREYLQELKELKPDALFNYQIDGNSVPTKTITFEGEELQVPVVNDAGDSLDFSRADAMADKILEWNNAHPDQKHHGSKPHAT